MNHHGCVPQLCLDFIVFTCPVAFSWEFKKHKSVSHFPHCYKETRGKQLTEGRVKSRSGRRQLLTVHQQSAVLLPTLCVHTHSEFSVKFHSKGCFTSCGQYSRKAPVLCSKSVVVCSLEVRIESRALTTTEHPSPTTPRYPNSQVSLGSLELCVFIAWAGFKTTITS